MSTTILDRVMARPHQAMSVIHPDVRRAFTRAVPLARKFVFSEKASRLVGRFAFQCPDLILQNWQFAIPPHQTTYIEMDSRAFFESFNQDHLVDKTSDLGVGYLISGTEVFVVARGATRNGRVPEDAVCPVAWRVGAPGQWVGSNIDPRNVAIKREDGSIADISGDKEAWELWEWVNLMGALGGASSHIADNEQRANLLQSVKINLACTQKAWQILSREENGQIKMIQNQAGDVRNMWAALLWLNQPKHVRLVDMPAGHKLVRGKRVSYSKHNVVEIDLNDRIKLMRRHFELLGPRESPRRHEVRGFFRHWSGDPLHSHTWPLFPDVDGHWNCSGCGRKRMWINDFLRGDAEKGFVTKEYAVGVNEEKEDGHGEPSLGI